MTRPPVAASHRDRRQRSIETVPTEGDNMIGGFRSVFGGAKTGGMADAPPRIHTQYDAFQTGHNSTPLVDYGMNAVVWRDK